MSDLQEALEQLEYWLWHHYPDEIKLLNPGLTPEQIDEEVKTLPFKISKEVRELYQWRNGGHALFYEWHFNSEGLQFLPLSEAVKLTRQLTSNSWCIGNILREKHIPQAFMISKDWEEWMPFVDCRNEDASPVLLVTDSPHIRLSYISLTSMALTALECYEKEVLSFTRFGGIQLNDEGAYVSILMRNNVGYDAVRQQYAINDPLQGIR
jgi:hypothetical protein